MSLGLDGWATNAAQSATEHISRTARMLSSVTARFGYVVETVSGVACLLRGFALQWMLQTGRAAALLIIIASVM